MIPVKLPKEVLALFPMWEYCCPVCNTYVEPDTPFCPKCKIVFNEKKWRVPPRFLKSKEAMSEYAHKILAPKLSPRMRRLLLKYFTEYLNDDFEGTSPWDGTHEQNGTVTYGSTDQAHHGSKSGKSVTTNQSGLTYALLREGLGTPTERYFRAYLYLSSLTPDNEANILHMMFHASSTPSIWCILGIGASKDGATPKWRVRYATDGGGAWAWIASPAPEAETWFCIEIYYKKHATEGHLAIWINNNDENNPTWELTSQDTDGQTLGHTYLGIIASAWQTGHTAYHDCAIIADTFIGTEAAGQTYTKTWATDVLFKKLGITQTFAVDMALQKQDIPKTFNVDIAFLKTVVVQRQIDVLFKKLDILKTFGVDVDFLKKDVVKSFAVDARFGAVVTHTISRQIDVLFEKLGVTRTFGVDAYFGAAEAVAYTKSFALDVVFAYKVRLPEIWLNEEGKIVLNVSRPYVWVGS